MPDPEEQSTIIRLLRYNHVFKALTKGFDLLWDLKSKLSGWGQNQAEEPLWVFKQCV